MISIGAYYGGPEYNNSHIDKRIRALMKAVSLLRDPIYGLDSDPPVRMVTPAINVVFHIPGSLYRPDFEGVRDATFSRRWELLMVQVAVPDELLNSERLDAFLIDSLHGSNALAFRYFKKKKMNYPLREADDLVERVRDALGIPQEYSKPANGDDDKGSAANSSIEEEQERDGSKGATRKRESQRYCLVFHWAITGIQDFEWLISVEDDLIRLLERASAEVDGHEYGSGHMYIFVFTGSPVVTFDKTKKVLREHDALATATVAYRKIEEGDYTTIWPCAQAEFPAP